MPNTPVTGLPSSSQPAAAPPTSPRIPASANAKVIPVDGRSILALVTDLPASAIGIAALRGRRS